MKIQGLQEGAKVPSVRTRSVRGGYDIRQGNGGRLWQDLNMAYTQLPRYTFSGPEDNCKIRQLIQVPFLKPQEPPPAPHCLRKNPKTTHFCP